MESKDDQAPQPDADDARFRERPLLLRVPTHGRIAGFEPSWLSRELKMPDHLRSQEPADQPPQPGEPDFEPLPLPVPHTMRVVPVRPLFDQKDLEIPAHLRGPTRGTQ